MVERRQVQDETLSEPLSQELAPPLVVRRSMRNCVTCGCFQVCSAGLSVVAESGAIASRVVEVWMPSSICMSLFDDAEVVAPLGLPMRHLSAAYVY